MPRSVRFGIALAILGVLMLSLPPRIAFLVGVIVVLGALSGSGGVGAGPIKAFADWIYGG